MNDALHNKVVKWFYDHEELLIAIMNKTPYQSDGWDYEIEVVKEFLTQTEQEPVVWMYQDKSTHEVRFQKHMRGFVDHGATYETPLYTTPPQRTWVGLTDIEWSDLYEAHHDKYNLPKQGSSDGMDYERAIEAKLKEKNT